MSKKIDVVIDGVRYIAEPQPDEIKFYFMYDGHYFSRLYGTTIDEVLEHADRIKAEDEGSYGMLCPAILLCGGNELRRSGISVHAGAKDEPEQRWNSEKAKWRKEMEDDADVMRLIRFNLKK